MNDLPNPAATALTKAEVLRTRARALAQETASALSGEGALEVVEFALAYESYAVETIYVREVCPLHDLTPVPCTPDFVCGIVNLRGEIVPVLDVKRIFGLPDKGLVDRHHVLVLQAGRRELGLLVDAIHGVRRLPAGDLQPPLPTLSGVHADYLRGVTAERLVVLDARRLLSSEQLIVCEEVTA